MKFYKVVARPTQLHGTETWVTTTRDMTRLEAVEMCFLRSVKGYKRLDKIRNEVIRKKLETCGIKDVRSKHKQNWINHLEGMDNTRLPKHALNYKPLRRRDRGRRRKRRQRVDAGTGQSTLSMEEDNDDDDTGLYIVCICSKYLSFRFVIQYTGPIFTDNCGRVCSTLLRVPEVPPSNFSKVTGSLTSVIFLSPSRQVIGWYLKLDRDLFLLHGFY
jgi:hypothetical protein